MCEILERATFTYSASNLSNSLISCMHSHTHKGKQTLLFIFIVTVIFSREKNPPNESTSIGIAPAVKAELDTHVSCISGLGQAALDSACRLHWDGHSLTQLWPFAVVS